jgi:tetratricopeptide (TPR) repeat protein
VAKKAYETTRIADLERADGWSPIRLSLDVRGFGINAWTAHEADASVIPEHDERPSGHEELYVVTAGHATFTVEGDHVDAPAGTIVFVRDPEATRGAVAREPGTTVLSVGGKPGEAYRPLSWETNRDVFALLDSGRAAEAKSLLTEALDRYDDRSTLFYNLACAEAQLGETDAAFEHLRSALGQRPSLADNARDDADLEPLRDDPRFPELVAVS